LRILTTVGDGVILGITGVRGVLLGSAVKENLISIDNTYMAALVPMNLLLAIDGVLAILN
jgi:hypothetical protein